MATFTPGTTFIFPADGAWHEVEGLPAGDWTVQNQYSGFLQCHPAAVAPTDPKGGDYLPPLNWPLHGVVIDATDSKLFLRAYAVKGGADVRVSLKGAA